MVKAHWLDYLIFSALMLMSVATGIYFSTKPQNTEDYLYGRHKMHVLPVSASLVVSYLSAVTMMGVPAEVYVYGIQYSVMLISLVGIWIAAITFVPLYQPLQLTSVYKYLTMRFNSKPLLILAYIMTTCAAFTYMGIILYAPAAALESVIGFPTWINIIGVSVVCTVYTSIGGMKAVVWNDLFQAIVMVSGLTIVIVSGIVKVGGIQEVWHELKRREATTLNLEPDPTLRLTLWYGFVCILSQWGVYSNQPAMMRFGAVPSKHKAQCALLLCSLGEFTIHLLAISAGAVVLAYYSKIGCDPLETNAINSPNQIIPYFLVDAVGIPGFPGLFLAAIVASSLSSISSVQNAMASVFWKDIALPMIGPVADVTETLALKCVVVVNGIISTVIAFGVKYIGGTLIQMALLLISVTDAPPVGIFILGATFRFPGGIAALIGCLVSIALSTCLHLGRYYAGVEWSKPHKINDSCPVILNNVTSSEFPSIYSDNEWSIFRLSPYLYPSMGITTTIIIAMVLSLLPCLKNNTHIDQKLLFPFVRKKENQCNSQNSQLNDILVSKNVTEDNRKEDNRNHLLPEIRT